MDLCLFVIVMRKNVSPLVKSDHPTQNIFTQKRNFFECFMLFGRIAGKKEGLNGIEIVT